MGYTTYFEGEIRIDPPLNEGEANYLRRFNRSRRMTTSAGPYFADPGSDFGQFGWSGGTFERAGGVKITVIDANRPPDGQPGLWCQWTPTDDGAALVWDEGEKFYDSPEWMKYIIDHFLRPGAVLSGRSPAELESAIPEFREFTFNHVLDGEIHAQGEEPDDQWMLVVETNRVYVRHSRPVEFGEPEEV